MEGMTEERLEEIRVKYGAMGWKEELWPLVRLLSAMELHGIVEIGTFKGGMLKIWEELLEEDGALITIDKRNEVKTWDLKKTTKNLTFIQGLSQDEETVEKVREILGERKIDFLFIDGSHKYEDVKRDFELYLPFVRKGGIVALHDIRAQDTEIYRKTTTVSILWAELKKVFRTMEILPPWECKGSDGIGVVFVD